MKARALLWLAASVAICLPVRGVDLRARSESSSKQFVVFSTDIRLRQRVASYAEELKADVLQLLGDSDHWKMPIVITLERASAQDSAAPPAQLRLVDTPAGQKIEINVKIGDDPASVNFQKYLLRALLLEYAYRGIPVKGGTAYVEPPWWVVEGLVEMERRRDSGIDSDLFRRLVEANHLPPLEGFLMEKPEQLSPTAVAVDRALAMGLLQMLADQPRGHENLAHLVRAWPQSNGDPMALLAKQFPAVAGNRTTLQKWWTVNLARFAAVDRYQALTVAETDKTLADLLEVELVINKAGEKKTFAVADFAHFMKLPASRTTLAGRQTEIIALGTRANALMRPVVTGYEEILALLSRGKTHGLRDRLEKVEAYRAVVLRRTSEIADYLNWWEATQLKSRSGEFDNYLKTANEISEQDRKQTGPIGKYLDELEQEF
jgi:hypothetical protein